MTGIIIIIVVGAAIALLSKFGAKANMESKLGRRVEEHELVSLNSWMDAKEATPQAPAASPKDQKKPPKQAEVLTRTEKLAKLREDFERESAKLGDNCPSCGAALSKSLPYCDFCGYHTSREALETHCAIFLVDLEKEFDDLVPARHAIARLGCVVLPMAGTAIAGIVILLTNAREACTILACAAAGSAFVGYLWTVLSEKSLDEKESAIFAKAIAPKIKQFIRRNNLKEVKFLRIAGNCMDKDQAFVKCLFRQL